MFDLPSFRIGRLFGIPIEVNVSWIVIFALVAFSLGAQVFPSVPSSAGSPMWLFYLVGAVTAFLFFASIVMHELCHSLVARAQGGHVDRITLFIFGGVAQIDEEPTSAGREFLMAAAGPAMSVLIALLCFIGFVLSVALALPWWVAAPLQYLAGINLFVGIFNLLPGFPLDGGRVLRAVLWGATGDLLRATRWAAHVGQAIGWTLATLAVLNVFSGRSDFIWLGLIGWFIASLAGQALRQQTIRSAVQGVKVQDAMTSSPEFIDGSESVETLVDDYFLGKRHSRYPVFHDGAIMGIVTPAEAKVVPRQDWPNTRVVDIASRDVATIVVRGDEPLERSFARLATDRPGALLVVEQGRLVGILTRSDVIHAIERGVAVQQGRL